MFSQVIRVSSAIVSVVAPPGFLPHFILVLYIPSVCVSLLISSLFLDYQTLSFSLLIISLSPSLPHPSISLIYSSVCLIYHAIGLVYPFESHPLSLHATCPLPGRCPRPPSSPVPSWRLSCLCPLVRDPRPYLGHSPAVYAGPYGSTPCRRPSVVPSMMHHAVPHNSPQPSFRTCPSPHEELQQMRKTKRK